MKKIMAVSCSHGHHMDKEAAKAALAFKKRFKPDMTIHLGDFIDVSAFMGSHLATGEGDEIMPDLMEGFDFLKALEPDLIFLGNHEDRLWRLQDHHKELIAWAAKNVIDRIEYMARSLKAELIPYAGTFDPNSWREIGGYAWGHGFMYGEMCARDHAEMLGMPVVFGHCHKLIRQPGRVVGAPEGISVGCLASIPAMAYAKTRRQTAAWDNGWVWGEYNEKGSKLYLERVKQWERPVIPHRG